MAKHIVSAQEFHSVVLEKTLNPKAMSARLAQIAKDKLAAVEARQGVFPYRRKVDGVFDALEEQVQPTGQIVYFIEAYKRVFDELFDMVYQRSPWERKGFDQDRWGKRGKQAAYRSVHYNQAWVLVINYKEVHPFAEGKERTPKPGEIWSLVNVMPYSRRLAKGWSVQGPSGWLEIIATTFYNRYKNFLVQGTKGGRGCRFEYITPPADAFTIGGVRGPNQAGVQWLNDNRYPAITIEIPYNAMSGATL